MDRHRKPIAAKRIQPGGKGGFTLIELLLAVLIISFLGEALYGVFTQGIRLWRRAVREKPEIEIDLYFEKLTADLRNAFNYPKKPFIGNEEAMEFYSLSDSVPQISRKGAGLGAAIQPIRIQYQYRSEAKSIYRAVTDYFGILSSTKESARVSEVARHIVRSEYRYFRNDPRHFMDWVLRWSADCAPDAVKVNLDYEDQQKVKSVSKIISVPSGTCVS